MIEVIKITRVLAVILAVILTITANVFAEKYQLVSEGGKTEWRIVISDTASPSEKYGASELQKFLKEMSGAELHIVTDKEPISQHEIILGDNAHLRKLDVKIDFEKLGIEGCTIRTVGDHLLITGSKKRGTLYGVYAFMEKYLGWRWFLMYPNNINRIPKVNRIEIGDIDWTQIPALKYRHIGPSTYRGNKDVYPYGPGAPLTEELGGSYIEYEGHSFYLLVPPGKYFKEHPEYYSEIDGKRVIKNPRTEESGELCLTNPDVLRIATEGVRNIFLQHPEIDVVSVSQMDDTGTYCRCANCRAIDEREGTPMGSILTFVNKIAEAIEKEFPGKEISTFAYTYSIKPPKTVRPRKNVIIYYAPIGACFSHPIEECEKNRTFKETIESWHKLGARLYILDYAAQFKHYLLSFTNLGPTKANTRFYIRNGVVGILNKSYPTPVMLLRDYLLSKLFVDPDYDVDAAENEFLEAYYGKAAPPMRQYLDMLNDKIRKDNLHFGCYAQPSRGDAVSVPISALLTPEVIGRAEKIFDEAEKLVQGNNEKLLHIQKNRLGIWYFQINTMDTTDPKRAEIIAKFLNGIEKSPELGKVGWVREGEPMENYTKKLKVEIGLEKPLLEVRSVATGDVDGDGSNEIITIAGAPESNGIIVLKHSSGGTGPTDWTWTFNDMKVLAYAVGPAGERFNGVTTGDLDGDGKAEIITIATGGDVRRGNINVFKYTPGTGSPLSDWSGDSLTNLAWATNPEIGFIEVATGDVDKNNKDEIVAISNTRFNIFRYTPNTGSPVSGWSGNNLTSLAWATNPEVGFIGGTTGDVDGNGKYEIVTIMGGNVSVFGYTETDISSPGEWVWDNIRSVAWATNVNVGFNGVTTGDIDGDGKDEIITIAGGNFSVFGYTEADIAPPGGWGWDNIKSVAWATRPASEQFNGVATGDVDKDGKEEIVTIAGGNFSVFGYTEADIAPPGGWGWDNIKSVAWGTRPAGEQFNNITTGDVEKDGKSEIVVIGVGQTTEDIDVYKYTPNRKGAPRDNWDGANVTVLGHAVKPAGEPFVSSGEQNENQ